MKYLPVYIFCSLATINSLLTLSFAESEFDIEDDEMLNGNDAIDSSDDFSDLLKKEDLSQSESVELEKALKTMPFISPSLEGSFVFSETFQDTNWSQKWKSPTGDTKFRGTWEVDVHKTENVVGDRALRMQSSSSHHAIAAQFTLPIESNKNQDLFASMEVQYEEDVNCGGAYFKLFDSETLRSPKDLSSFDNETPYVIMFGPDKCGTTNKVHFILRWKNEISGEWQESHLRDPVKVPGSVGVSHQYGFSIHPSETYQIYLDGKVEKSGSIREDFHPGFETQAFVSDPEDKKPENWVDTKMIPDTTATKPEDWDESAEEFIPDVDAQIPDGWLPDEPALVPNDQAIKPEDWDDGEDGPWTPPLVKNPACLIGCGEWKRPTKRNPDYKGKWSPPMIPNPDYVGPWKAKEIMNPNHFKLQDIHKLYRLDAIGFELWTVNIGATFDNIVLTHDRTSFDKFINETYQVKRDLEQSNFEARRSARSSDMPGLESPQSVTMRVFNAIKSYGRGKPVQMVALTATPCVMLCYLFLRVFKKIRKPIGVDKKNDDLQSADNLQPSKSPEKQKGEEEKESMKKSEDEAGLRKRKVADEVDKS